MDNFLLKPIKNTNRIFNIIFIMYVALMFCFNDQSDFLIYMYIAWTAVMVLAAIKILRDVHSIELHRESILLVLYTIYAICSSLWAKEPYLAISKSMTVFLMSVFAFVAVIYFNKTKNINPILCAITIAGVVLSIYVIISYGGIAEYYRQASIEGTRMGDKVGQINSIDMHCAYTVILLFYYAFYKKKYILYPVAILPFIVSMSSGSRKALLILAGGIVLMLYLSQDNKIKNFKHLVKVICLLGIAATLFILVLDLPIMATVKTRMESFLKVLFGGVGDNSAMVRSQMIKVGWEQFKETPFFGIGLNNAQLVNKSGIGKMTYLHNDYIEQLVNLGIAGFILYYSLLAILFVKHIKLLKARKPEIVASFVLLTIFLINSWGMVTYYSKTTYLFMVLWISVVNVNEDKLKKENIDAVKKDI